MGQPSFWQTNGQMPFSMHIAGSHLPMQAGCLCMTAGRCTGILVAHQICVVGDDESCAGYGLGSAHFVMNLDGAMGSVGVVTSSHFHRCSDPVVTSAVTPK